MDSGPSSRVPSGHSGSTEPTLDEADEDPSRHSGRPQNAPSPEPPVGWLEITSRCEGDGFVLLRDIELRTSRNPGDPTVELSTERLHRIRIDITVDAVAKATLTTLDAAGEPVDVELNIYDLKVAGRTLIIPGVPHDLMDAEIRRRLAGGPHLGPACTRDDFYVPANQLQPVRPRMPERKRSRRARLLSITRRKQRKLKEQTRDV